MSLIGKPHPGKCEVRVIALPVLAARNSTLPSDSRHEWRENPVTRYAAGDSRLSFLLKTGGMVDSAAKVLRWACTCFANYREREITDDLRIETGELWRVRLWKDSGRSLARRRTEEECPASIRRGGQLRASKVWPHSKGKPGIGGVPGDVSGLTPEVRRNGLRDLAK
jgi:hypothetical protein